VIIPNRIACGSRNEECWSCGAFLDGERQSVRKNWTKKGMKVRKNWTKKGMKVRKIFFDEGCSLELTEDFEA
jgi:hypothetical protein